MIFIPIDRGIGLNYKGCSYSEYVIWENDYFEVQYSSRYDLLKYLRKYDLKIDCSFVMKCTYTLLTSDFYDKRKWLLT